MDLSKTKPSANFTDRTGATRTNDFHKFMIGMLMDAGFIEAKGGPFGGSGPTEISGTEMERLEKQAKEAGGTVNPDGTVNMPLFPELNKVWNKITK
jgi:hypothetical protein